MRRAVVLMMLVACARERVYVTSTMLHSHIVEIRDHGKATMETSVGDSFELSRGDTVKVNLGGESREVKVSALIEGCPDHRPFAGDEVTRTKYKQCGLLRVNDIEVDRQWVGRPGVLTTTLGIVLVLTVVGVVGGYLGNCAEADDGC
jgi:hypothetical protein